MARLADKDSCQLSGPTPGLSLQARYLKDSLDEMLGCPVFLDSSNLADLRQLFHGVHTSEVPHEDQTGGPP